MSVRVLSSGCMLLFSLHFWWPNPWGFVVVRLPCKEMEVLYFSLVFPFHFEHVLTSSGTMTVFLWTRQYKVILKL